MNKLAAMKLLFPYRMKKPGWIILVPFIILGILDLFHVFDGKFTFLNARMPSLHLPPDKKYGWIEMVNTNLTPDIIGLGLLLGCLFVGFSALKNEDEYSRHLRLNSLLWATYITAGFLFVSYLIFYDFAFLNALLIVAYLPLILYILRFHWLIGNSKSAKS